MMIVNVHKEVVVHHEQSKVMNVGNSHTPCVGLCQLQLQLQESPVVHTHAALICVHWRSRCLRGRGRHSNSLSEMPAAGMEGKWSRLWQI